MRTSLRLFAAAATTLLAAAVVAVVPFAPTAQALNGVSVISVDSATVSEAAASVNVTVRVSPAPNVPFDTISARITRVDVSAKGGAAAGPGVDYKSGFNDVVWNFNDPATKTINIPLFDDGHREPNETFTFTITNVQSGSAGSVGTVTINDNEGGPVPTFTITAPAAAPEGNDDNLRMVTVSINPPSAQAVTLNYATSDGTATSDTAKGAVDYTKIATQQLQWVAGNGDPQVINVTVKGDTLAEPDERFFLNFGSPNNAAIVPAQNPANIDLTNDDGAPSDVPKLTVEPVPDKTEGDTSTTNQTVTVTLAPAAGQTVTVDYATANGTATASTADVTGDYTETKETLTFPQGVTSKTFTVPVVGDPAHELDEIYTVTLSNPANASIATGSREAKIVNDDFGQMTTVPGQNGGPHLRLFGATGSDLGGYMTYGPTMTAGLHVARGDFFTPTQQGFAVGADGIDEVVLGPGAFPAGSKFRSLPIVKIYSTSGTEIASFLAYDSGFPGGVYVAAGNLDGDASNGDELVVGAGGGGGPHVKVLRVKGPGDNVAQLAGFFAYDAGFNGGVRVAVGDLGGDAKDEIVTAPGPGGGPHVRVFLLNADASTTPIAGFMAYDPAFAGGVFVDAAKGRIVTGPGAGGGPHVRLFDGSGAALSGGFMAYEPAFGGGVSVALGNLDNDLAAEIVTGAGPGGGPHVKVFRADGSLPFGGGFFAYDAGFHGGVEVAVSVAGN